MCTLKEIWNFIIDNQTASAITFFAFLFAVFVWLLSICKARLEDKKRKAKEKVDDERFQTLFNKIESIFLRVGFATNISKWHFYVDCIYQTIRKYLGNQSLEEQHFLYMEKNAERLIKEYGISMEDAEILAVVNFCQDVRFQGESRTGYTMDGNYDEIVLKLLKNLSEKALEPFSEVTKQKIKSA